MSVNIFQKYRLLVRIIVNLFVIWAIDITVGITYKKINGYAWFSAWEGSILPIEQDKNHVLIIGIPIESSLSGGTLMKWVS